MKTEATCLLPYCWWCTTYATSTKENMNWKEYDEIYREPIREAEELIAEEEARKELDNQLSME
jgi:hypothetical protein